MKLLMGRIFKRLFFSFLWMEHSLLYIDRFFSSSNTEKVHTKMLDFQFPLISFHKNSFLKPKIKLINQHKRKTEVKTNDKKKLTHEGLRNEWKKEKKTTEENSHTETHIACNVSVHFDGKNYIFNRFSSH